MNSKIQLGKILESISTTITHLIKNSKNSRFAFFVNDIVAVFVEKRGNLLAKGVAYSLLLALLPIIFLLISFIPTFFAEATELQEIVLNRLEEFLPPSTAEATLDHILKIGRDRSWFKIGLLGLISLFIAPRTLFASLEMSLTSVMSSPHHPKIVTRQIRYLLFTIVVILLFFLSTFFYIWSRALVDMLSISIISNSFLSKGVSSLITFVTIILIYRVFYQRKLHYPTLFLISFLVALSWQLINIFGSTIITIFGQNELIIGILAGAVITLVWGYLFSVILLIGGIIIAKKSHNLD